MRSLFYQPTVVGRGARVAALVSQCVYRARLVKLWMGQALESRPFLRERPNTEIGIAFRDLMVPRVSVYRYIRLLAGSTKSRLYAHRLTLGFDFCSPSS